MLAAWCNMFTNYFHIAVQPPSSLKVSQSLTRGQYGWDTQPENMDNIILVTVRTKQWQSSSWPLDVVLWRFQSDPPEQLSDIWLHWEGISWVTLFFIGIIYSILGVNISRYSQICPSGKDPLFWKILGIIYSILGVNIFYYSPIFHLRNDPLFWRILGRV